MGYGKLMVGVVIRIQMLFIEVANRALEWHQGSIESVAGGTMVSVYPATESWKGQGGGGKRMYKGSQGQKESLHKDVRGQELGALLISAKGRGHKYDLQWYI